MQSNQQQHVYKARGIKVNSHYGFKKESNLQMCYAARYATTEDIRR